MKIGNKIFDFKNKGYIMGILNVTPDSFSDGGNNIDLDSALYHTQQMIHDGADMIDVGGESTRPNYTMISEEEEIDRVCPVIEGIKKRFDIAISLDTYKTKVASAGIRIGVDMINDIWGLKWDGMMAPLLAEQKIPVCIMHNRKEGNYQNLIEDVKKDLLQSIDIAISSGVTRDRIILDPGIGFAKSLDENLLIMKHLESITELGYPLLLGTSRKSMIGLSLNLNVNEREEGTMATTVIGRIKGCSIFRVHNVKGNLRTLKMTEEILKAGDNQN